MTTRTLARRVSVARNLLAARTPAERGWLDLAGWLARLEECERAGHFNQETDFPRALAFYLAALAEAPAAEPATEPQTSDPRPVPAFVEHLRIGDRYPDVAAAAGWLREIAWRVECGIPRVTETEFAELAAWFEANEQRLASLADASTLRDVGCGRRTCCWSIRHALRAGPRADGAGEVAEVIRQLRARYGSGV